MKKDSDRAIITEAEAVCVPAHLVLPGSLKAKQLCHFHPQLSLEQSYHRQKKFCVYACRVALVMSNSLRPCGLWPARLLCQGGGFSRQEYWSVSANTGCYTLLLLLSHFSSVQLCATPSLGFSRQEHWSELAITGCHTLWSTVFPAALATSSPENLVLPEPL